MPPEPHPKRLCAYCGSEHLLTREHLWPAALHRRLVVANQNTGSLFWLRRIDREVQGEPTLRDVCKPCNNGVLSTLDEYACSLFDRYCARILQRHEKVIFEYDYHLLKRWLLKMTYNSARMHNSMELFAYPALLPYIKHDSLSAGKSVQLFVQLAYPGTVPCDRFADADLADAPTLWEPEDNRCGHFDFNVPGVGRKVLRAVHLRSYSFFLAFFEPGEKSATLKHFAETFLRMMSASALLLPSHPRIELVCDGMDAWKSIDAARENKFVRTGKTGAQ
jgi:hypothetical protein